MTKTWELFNSFTFPEGDDQKLESVISMFEKYCSPKSNVIFERYKFNSIVQKEGQPFDSFLTELSKAVKTTEYQEKDDMVRDRIVMGVRDKHTQESLLRESNLTLEKAVNLCRATEVSKSQAKILKNESALDAVKVGKGNLKNFCKFCGYDRHGKNGCYAYGKTCARCQGKNHFASVCTSVSTSGKNISAHKEEKKKQFKNRKQVHELGKKDDMREEDIDSESDGEFYVNNIAVVGSVSQAEKNMWTQDIDVNGCKVSFKLDTGAEVSVLPLCLLKTCHLENKLDKTGITLVSYGNKKFKIKPVGQVYVDCRVKDNFATILFVIVDVDEQIPLLGLPDCMTLKLIYRNKNIASLYTRFQKLEDVIKLYPSVF